MYYPSLRLPRSERDSCSKRRITSCNSILVTVIYIYILDFHFPGRLFPRMMSVDMAPVSRITLVTATAASVKQEIGGNHVLDAAVIAGEFKAS